MVSSTLPTCADALLSARQLGLERLDAQLLLLHALGKPASARSWLLAHDTDTLAPDAAGLFAVLSRRRAGGEPLAYLVGSQEFFGLPLQVDPRVLVPRPDTETLVEWALEVLQLADTPAELQVLDLGTGSGAIALAIAHSLQAAGRQARITAVDASADALDVARENARRLNLPLECLQSCWFAQVPGCYHLIVSNPPYIASADPHLPALRHEPLRALTAGADGMDDLRHIIGQAPGWLQPDGWLLLEHGHDQASRVCELFRQRGFVQIGSRPDLAGIARCSGGLWPA